MKTRKRAKRPFEPSDEDVKDFVGRDSLLFEDIQTRLAECYAVDGPDEKACIYQMAKCLVLKRHLPTQRSQLKAQIDEDIEALDAFNDLLLSGARESKIAHKLNSLSGESGAHLRRKVARQAHESTEAWIEALKEEIANVLMPEAIYLSLKVEQQLQTPSEKLTDQLFARELFYEKHLDDAIDRSRNRLLQIKATKRLITFRDFRRLDRAHPDRLGRAV